MLPSPFSVRYERNGTEVKKMSKIPYALPEGEKNFGHIQKQILWHWAIGAIKNMTEATAPTTALAPPSTAGRAVRALVKRGILEDLGYNRDQRYPEYHKNSHLFRRVR